MTKDCEELTVHAVSFNHRRVSVFYASLPSGPHTFETLNGFETHQAGEQSLVSALCDHLRAMESPLWKHCQSPSGDALTIQVVHGPLGKPHLLLGENRGPAVSFSEGGGRLWAAICEDDSDIGIDAAGPDEFPKDYPHHRAFHLQELQHALRLTGGNMENASALLWSVKEAAVKALGCGFHLVDPREIHVSPSPERVTERTTELATGQGGGYFFSVGLSGRALLRFSAASRWFLPVHSLPQRQIWISIALLNQQL